MQFTSRLRLYQKHYDNTFFFIPDFKLQYLETGIEELCVLSSQQSEKNEILPAMSFLRVQTPSN